MTSSEGEYSNAPAEATGPGNAGVVSDVAADLASRLEVLASLDHRPLEEHADVYQQLHAELQATLAEIDSA